MANWPYNTARWQQLRAAKLAADALCEDCWAAGRAVAATCVDHRHAISQGGAPFPPLDELSSKCTPCHSRKTVRSDEAGAFRSDKPMKGCTADGMPIDPAHPWA
jgi:5-methylcytosine-specific restriction protein A